MKALVIGGTGPSGPFVINGLLERGYEVTILHRGTHEVELSSEVEHIHADPHFTETIDEALGKRTFDLVVAMYGRLRHTAVALRNRTSRLVAAGGIAVYKGALNAERVSDGLPVPLPEDAPLETDPDQDSFSYLMEESERVVMERHAAGDYNATVLRIPDVYGPRQLIPSEWCILRRILDQRKHIIVPDGGLVIDSRIYTENLARFVLLCVDRPEVAAGQIYNVRDETVWSLRQWIGFISEIMGYQWDLVSLPAILAQPAVPYAMKGWRNVAESGKFHHRVLDLTKAKTELGYRDLVHPPESLERTIKWYLENLPEKGGEIEQRLGDQFDYEAEDRLIEAYQKSIKKLRNIYPVVKWRHPYPHPKKRQLRRDEVGR